MLHLVVASPVDATVHWVARAISLHSDGEAAAVAVDEAETLEAIKRCDPDVVLIDDELDVPCLLQSMADQHSRARAIIVAKNADALLEAVRLGACGVVSTDLAPALLVQCLREVHAGRKWYERRYAVHLLDRLLQRRAAIDELAQLLSPREVEVARLLGRGLNRADIARELSITEGTAQLHLHHLYSKLNVRGRGALQHFLHSKGIS